MALTRSLTLHQFRSFVSGLPTELRGAIRQGLRGAALRAVGEVVRQIDEAAPHPAVNFGQLRQSVSYRPSPQGGTIAVEAPHAPMIENGTRPFYPPIRPLQVWAARKFGLSDAEALRVAYAVQRAIGKRGIAPRHFFRKAMRRVRDEYVPIEIKRELEAI